MGAKKIVDEDEVLQWFREGKTYDFMIDYYKKHYNETTTKAMWSTFRRRKKLPRRNVRNADLIPWKVEEQHRYDYPVMMLRAEGRRLAGEKLTPADEKRLASWKADLKAQDLVVHYDPETKDGWFLIPRSEGDHELIHPPEKATGRKPVD
ncbi:hypothetical protein LKL35_26115 [Streptomyces sp. ET3-23]|uniref:hypothetical protein n=1 Tax=Streptomyces sp. ET3-23 TaxID=2885643 RepID=UPI001D11E68B|nr:hypothetical protein [Streptomyces sp. ET3-23]MCC2278877.1 hypothetical protein [Streptomyces sp. ET3-23]